MLEKLEYIIELSQDLVLELDRDGNYVNIWTKDESLLVLPKAELIGMNLKDALPEKEAASYHKLVKSVIDNQRVEEVFYKINTLKGERSFRGRLVPMKLGKKNTAVFVVKDITEKVQMQSEYDRQKELLNDIVNNSPGVIYQSLIKKNGDVSFPYLANNIFDIYGYTREDIVADNNIIKEAFDVEDSRSFYDKLKTSINETSKLDWLGKITDKDGKQKWIHVQGIPRKIEEGDTLITGLLIDITEQKRREGEIKLKEANLNHQLKLASLGELAAGVGHEINNPLNIIVNTLTILKNRNESEALTSEEIDNILKINLTAANRISKIVRGLKSLSRKEVDDQFKKFNFIDVLDTTYLLVKELCRKDHIELCLKLDRNKSLHIEGIQGEIEQVLMNLLSNSIDALKDTKNARIDIEVESKDESVITQVRDNGPGIPSEILSRIHDPFFTTKEVGRGTGLGLSLVNNIVCKHKGKIEFETSENGTVVFLTLPLASKK